MELEEEAPPKKHMVKRRRKLDVENNAGMEVGSSCLFLGCRMGLTFLLRTGCSIGTPERQGIFCGNRF